MARRAEMMEIAMTTYRIHGLAVDVAVYQGRMTPSYRQELVERAVAFCRQMPMEEFVVRMRELSASPQGTTESAAMLSAMDADVSRGYRRTHVDEYEPIVGLTLVEEEAATIPANAK